jgi:hypothetical protein
MSSRYAGPLKRCIAIEEERIASRFAIPFSQEDTKHWFCAKSISQEALVSRRSAVVLKFCKFMNHGAEQRYVLREGGDESEA